MAALLVASGAGGAPAPATQTPLPIAPGHEAPLPIAVRTPQDLAFKAEVERQYLIVNLMAGGRIGYEAGDFARAVRDWEALLQDPQSAAGNRARGCAVARRCAPPAWRGERARGAHRRAHPPGAAPDDRARATGGAAHPDGQRHGDRRRAIGPGGAVVWLKRLDGPTPLPRRGRQRLDQSTGQDVRPPRARDWCRRQRDVSQRRSLFSQRVFAERRPGIRRRPVHGRAFVREDVHPPRPRRAALQHPRVDARLHLRRRFHLLHAAAAERCLHDPQRATRSLRAVRLARIIGDRSSSNTSPSAPPGPAASSFASRAIARRW